MEGKELAGRYRLLTKLGEGGMGSVWRAEHLALHTLVAIKLIDPSIAASQEAAARFQREAQAAAELRSTHIVQIFDYGIDADIPFIVMELLEGESLAERLSRLGKLAPVDTARVFTQVSRALARAHQRGIVHRDLKPDNIFMVREDAEEVVKLLDFGIAKKLDGLAGSGDIKTHTGALLGTPYYMSPEQCLGQTDIDHHTDIWSMGVMAFECMLGKRPFERDTLGKLLLAICNDSIPKPSDHGVVPQGFDEWFAHAVNRSRSDRFHSASEAAAELRGVCRLASSAGVGDSPVPSIEARAHSEQEVAKSVLTGASLVHTTGPAAVTIPDAPADKPRRPGWALLAPVLVLLTVGVGYLLWHWTQPAVASRTVASTRELSLPQAPVPSMQRASAAVTSSEAMSTASMSPPTASAPSPTTVEPPSSAPVNNGVNATGPAASAKASPNAGSRTLRPHAPSHNVENAAGF